MANLKEWTKHDLLQAYRGYQKLGRTGAVGAEDFDGLFRYLIDEQTRSVPGAGPVVAASILLQEIAARWAADAEIEESMIQNGTHLWYLDKDTGEIEEAVVETVEYKNDRLYSFGVHFCITNDFDVFSEATIGNCFFKSEQQALNALHQGENPNNSRV